MTAIFWRKTVNTNKCDFIHRMNKGILGFLICASSLVASQIVSAAGVDFEDQGIPLNTQKDPNPAFVTSDGFRFVSGEDHLHIGSEQFWAYNGSTVLTAHYDVIFARTDSSLFSLSSLDLAGFPTSSEGTIQVIGTFADSSTISTTFTLDGVVDGSDGRIDFETFSLGADWINLVSARIVNTDPNANQGLFSVDNINIIPVPEPETYAMLLAGLGLLGFMARGRKETVV